MRVQTAEVTQIEGKPKAKPQMSLESLYAQHEGKVADKWSAYLREYDRILSPYRDRAIRLLEIGVQNGGSLEIWAEFFAHAERFIGCDIDPACENLRYEDPRIAIVVGDANSDAAQRRIVQLASRLDIVIDDGSHRSGDIVESFARYFPLLAEDGVFIVEDLHCSYWQDHEGGLFHPHSSMTFLKRLADVINHEHWGVSRFRGDLMQGISEQYGVRFHEHDLGRVHSVEFCNSMCVIRKAPTDHNLLGTRTIVGTEEAVLQGILDLKGMSHSETASQADNVWSIASRPPEDEILARHHELAPLAQHVALVGTLSEQLASRDATIASLQAQAAAQAERVVALEAQIVTLVEQRAYWQRALAERDRQLVELAASFAASGNSREAGERVARREREAVQRKLKNTENALAATRVELKKLKNTYSWRWTKPLRKVSIALRKFGPPGGFGRGLRRVRKVLRQQGVMGATRRAFEIVTGRRPLAPLPRTSKPGPQPAAPAPAARTFETWLRQYDYLAPEERAGLAARVPAFPKKPLISIILPTYNPNLQWLHEAIVSVTRQIYPHWELCIVDDASTNPAVRDFLADCAARDPRIRVSFRESNGHISLATNSGFDMAQGEWFALLDHDDLLSEHALFWVVDAMNKNLGARLVYSDEDKLNKKGERLDPYFKPDWNADLFLSHNMICHLAVYEAELVRSVGGCRQGFEGAQDYDLALRCTEKLSAAQIHHVPRVLYTWRVHEASTASDVDNAKPYAVYAGKRALDEHFERIGVRAAVEIEPSISYRIRYELPADIPLVSIIIPTRNAHGLVRQCIESVVRRSTYTNFEILLVDNGSDDPAALEYYSGLARDGVIRLIRDDRPFNYSALNNAAARQAQGEFLCLLNNDIEVISPDWLGEMVSIGLQPGVGAVGARLWYPNDHLQHGGVIVGLGGVAGHSHKHYPRSNRGYCGRAALIQSFSAVTAACLLVRKSLYQQVGGLNEVDLQVAFNDVDFCLRLREVGYRNVWTPYAELYHHESATRGYEDNPVKVARFEREKRYMRARWASVIKADPAYNPNLTDAHEDFGWAWPPRY